MRMAKGYRWEERRGGTGKDEEDPLDGSWIQDMPVRSDRIHEDESTVARAVATGTPRAPIRRPKKKTPLRSPV